MRYLRFVDCRLSIVDICFRSLAIIVAKSTIDKSAIGKSQMINRTNGREESLWKLLE